MNPPANGHAKLKVLLVEDNDDTRFLLQYILESAGYEVHATGTMQAAIEAFRRIHSDILLSDVGLPDGSGWELLRALREQGGEPYAIAMSGFGTLTDVDASAAAGFRHHLVKPVRLEALESLLEEARAEVRQAS